MESNMIPLVKIQHFNRKRDLHHSMSNNWLKMHGIPKRRKLEQRLKLNYGLVIGHLGGGKSFHHLRRQLYNQICEGK